MSTAEGHNQNIEEVFLCNRDWLRGYLKKRLGNEADADEALQEVFRRYIIRVRGPKTDAITNVASYLFATAKNVCSTRWRKRQITTVSYDNTDGRHILNQSTNSDATIPFEEARLQFQEFEELFPLIWEKLTSGFTQREIELLCMHRRKGMKISDIAETMNEDIEIISRDINRAGARLNQRIKAHVKRTQQ